MNTTPIQLNIELIQPKSGEDIKPLNQQELKLKGASQDFEALFLSYLIKSMRENALSEENSLFGSSRAEKIYTSMLDEQYAQEMAKSDGVGIWKLIFEQLRESLDTGKIATDAEIQVVIPADEVQSSNSARDSTINATSETSLSPDEELREIVQPDEYSQRLKIPIVISVDAQNQIDESELTIEIRQNAQSNSDQSEPEKRSSISGRHPYALALSIPDWKTIFSFSESRRKIALEVVIPATMPSESTEQLPVEGTPSKQQSANNLEIVTTQQAHAKQTESNPENRQVETLTTDDIEAAQLLLSDENSGRTQIAPNKSTYSEDAPLSGRSLQQNEGTKRLFIESDQVSVGKTDNRTLNSSSPAPNDTHIEEGQFNPELAMENPRMETPGTEFAGVSARLSGETAFQIETPDAQQPQVESQNPSSTRQIDRGAKPARNFPIANKQELALPDVRTLQKGENTTRNGARERLRPLEPGFSQFDAPNSTDTDALRGNHNPITKSTSPLQLQNSNSAAKTNTAGGVNLLEEETDSLKGVIEQLSNQASPTRGERMENLPESRARQLTGANLRSNRAQNKGTARSEAKGRNILSQTLIQKFEPTSLPAQSHRMDSLRNAVLEQVVRRMRIIRTETNSQVTIHLEPPELGHLNLKMVLEGNTLTARFEAQNEFVANIIRGNLAQLNAALSHHGIKVSGFEVAVSGGQAQLFQDGPDSNPSYIKDRRRRMRDDRIGDVGSFMPAQDSQKYIVDYRL